MADIVHGFEFGGVELDMKLGLDGDDEVDVVEGVPLGDVGGGEGGGEDESVVVEEISKDGGELGVDLLLLHVEDVAPETMVARWIRRVAGGLAGTMGRERNS